MLLKRVHLQIHQNDPNSPFYIHPNDYPRQLHVKETLNDGNYAYWSREIKDFLFAKNMVGFINGNMERPPKDTPYMMAWQRSDAIINSWLTTVMEKEIRDNLKHAHTTREIWEELEERFGKESAPRAYELKWKLASTK